MRSSESLFNDSNWEIRIPNAQIEALQEDYKLIIHAKPRTHVFYDETVLFFLQISLPNDLSTLHEETERQITEFFQTLEIQVEAAFVDALALATAASSGPGQHGPFSRPTNKRMSVSSPGPYGGGGRLPLGGDQGRMESTLLYSYTYNPLEIGKEPVIRPINGLWTAIFPFSVPVSFVKTKATNTVLMLSAHVSHRPTDQVVPAAIPLDDQYNVECFNMVNLLEGLSDDPNFPSSLAPQHHYRPDTPRARVQAPPMAPLLRRSVRRSIAVRSALNVRMRTTRVSPTENPLMMSIEVENNSEHGAKFKTTQLDVEVTHAVVTPLDSAGLTKLPMVLNSSDHVTFLFSVSLLENPELNPTSPAIGNTPFGGHNRHSTESLVPTGVFPKDSQRQVTIVLQGVPEVDGVQGQTIHSRWNCFLDVSEITKQDNASSGIGVGVGVGVGPGAGPSQKQLFAPHPSHPSGLLPPPGSLPYSSSGTPTNSQHHQYQLHQRNRSLPSSPQPQHPSLQKTMSLRVTSSGSPPVHNSNRESRVRRSSVVSDGTPAHYTPQGQRGSGGGTNSALSSANRRSGLGWGYGRPSENNQGGLAPVQEGSTYRSPVIGHGGAGSESEGDEDEAPLAVPGNTQQSGRPTIAGNAMSPGLGLDLASQALTEVTQGRAEQDTGDGIVISFAVVVGKIFNLEIFIVNRSRHIRRYTLVVPNRKRAKGGDPSQGSKVLPPLPSGERAVIQSVPIDPYMEESELLRRHVDNETTEADIICLENNIRLSPLYPLTCQNLNLRFIAIKEQLHTIDLVQLVDNDTGFVTNLRNCLCFMAEASFGALSQQVPEVRNRS
ncbi:hypothetical protein BX616_000817 [Lobosporangium transversale]|nr:hypothetical protein BX616_000817 [Lobosporangium transversale]